MSTVDPVVEVLADLDQPATPTAEFRDALLARLLAEPRPAAEPRPGRERSSRVHSLPGVRWRNGSHRRVAALAAAVLVVVAGAASAFGTVLDIFGNAKPAKTSFFSSEGKRGSFAVRLLLTRNAAHDPTREWRIGHAQGRFGEEPPTGQYAHVTGRGRIVRIGGNAQGWHARLQGFVRRPGEAKQRVVITMKGRPEGVFVLTTLDPGSLKRDSGTQTYSHATG